ncbi:MAG: HRDC domain-containing protein, partial [Planctomycetota bacterium]|nr:HRDC domain-containing protein [Planctomycetota bacterium]
AAILRAAAMQRRFGRRKLTLILAGSAAKDLPSGHPAHGALKDVTQAEIGDWIQSLIDEGYLGLEGDEYPVVAVTPKGAQALKMGETLSIARAPVSPPAQKRSARVNVSVEAGDDVLLARLRTWRRDRAQLLGKPAYVVFTDKTLHAIATTKPDTEQRLLAVPGIGPAKWEAFGEKLLAVIAGASASAD